MVKIDNIERTSFQPTTKARWLVLCSFSLILGALVGTQILVPLSSIRGRIFSSSYPVVQSLPFPELEETKKSKSPRENAEVLLIDSLVLFQELLVRISDGDSSNALSSKKSNKHAARGLASDIGGFFKNMTGAAAGEGLSGGFSGLLGNLGLGNITSSLGAGAADASKYLGIGLGNGTITGLELPPNLVKTNKIMQEKPTGINLIAANLGQGLTSSLVGSINLTAAAPDPQTYVIAAKAVGEGVGSGAAVGLNLKPKESMVYSNDTGIAGIAGNLAQGLTSSLLSGIDVNSLMSMGNFSGEQVNGAAKALAQGLGSGAAYATKLSPNPPSAESFDQKGISGIAGNLGQGLSTSFLQDIPFQQLLSSNAPSLSSSQISDAAKGLGAGLAGGAVVGVGLQADGAGPNVQLMPGGLGVIAESFGRGLSQSFLTNGTVTKLLASAQPANQIDVGNVAKGLAIGLVDGATTGFDNAGGVKNIFNMEPGSTPQVTDLTKPTTFDDGVGGAATGFGNGLGLQVTTFVLQLFGKPPLNQNTTSPGMMTLGMPENGQPANGQPANGQPASETPAKGQPSSGQPANGQPASGQPVKGQPAGGQPASGQPASGQPAGGQPAGGQPASGQPANGQSVKGQPSTETPALRLHKRQTATIVPANPSGQQTFSSSDLLNLPEFNGTISPIVQKAVDTLKCQGIGGLVTVLFSVGSSQISNTKSIDVNDLKDKVSRLGFAKQTINIKDKESGNQYDVNIAEFQVKVNGNGLTKQIVVLVLHILLGIVAFGTIIPTIIIIGSIRNFAVMSGYSDKLKNSRRIQWILGLVIVLPSTLIILITGIISEGVKSHFTSVHGILGLILVLFTLPIFPLAYLASQNKAKLALSIVVTLVLSLILLVLITGFIDLSALVFCATQIIPLPIVMFLGISLAAPLLLATTLLSLELLLGRWRGGSNGGKRLSNLTLGDRSSVEAEEGLGAKAPMIPMNNPSQGEKNFISI